MSTVMTEGKLVELYLSGSGHSFHLFVGRIFTYELMLKY